MKMTQHLAAVQGTAELEQGVQQPAPQVPGSCLFTIRIHQGHQGGQNVHAQLRGCQQALHGACAQLDQARSC